MSIDSLLAELNGNRRMAASIPRQHTLILARPGTGFISRHETPEQTNIFTEPMNTGNLK